MSVCRSRGRHVRKLPLELAFTGGLHATGRLGYAEVEHTRLPVGTHEDVLRRNVAVHDPERLAALVRRFVRGMKPLEDPHHDRDGDGRRQSGFPLACRADETRQGLARHVIHHEKELAVRRDDVERRDHVRMANASRKAGLVQEHRHELGIGAKLRVKSLDGDRAREAHRTDETPEVNRRHAP
jgi:hypothetical protein